MAHIYADRVKETASNKPNASTAFNLPDTGATGYRSFDSVLASADTCIYGAENGTDWEVGLGTFTAGSPDTLTRTTILSSSTGSAIDWSAGGDVSVFITADAKRMAFVENSRLNGFSAYGDGTNTQSIADATLTNIANIYTELWDTGGFFTPSTGIFFPTLAGRWLISGTLVLGAMADQKFFVVYVQHSTDGSTWSNLNDKAGILSRGSISAANLQLGGSGAIIVEANGTTDRFALAVYQNNGSAVNAPASAANRSWLRFSARYLGETS